ncbi:dimethylglycine dehydrogenase [Rhodoligotrophos appendicifer]|uniref:GcvT family protein n=1 Tax=Rhodoligotrophos appendicifer TaxID=987056 RepID=UPI001186317C|nr:FAD-dependent oxidoreductase [Rhodoligotrophos appendicifer]
MKSHAQVVVIGGGVVGCSVLYHLTKKGWRDVVLVEREELTSGSTWHAAGGFHTLNGDPNVAKLQAYTVKLYKEIEEISGQSCGLHLTGGLQLAGTPARMEWLKMAHARGRYLGMETELISPADAKQLLPMLDERYYVGAMWDPVEGHLDPSGTTHAYAKSARIGGAEIYRQTRVTELVPTPEGHWDVVTTQGTIRADHVVNAGGLWAREVGRMVGIELPVLAMEHMYVLTEDMPEVAEIQRTTGKEVVHVIDFEAELYTRQEGQGILIGTYEKACVPWSPRVTPWDFGQELLKPDLDRIAPSLEMAFDHMPALKTAGIKRIVNGPFTFSPDGNPLVGPVRGLKNFWCACAVMAGFSQGGGVGLALSNWMVDGDPGFDVWGMDVSRFGDWATLGYTNAKVRENYSRRFSIRFPNEELPAARPIQTTALYDLFKSQGAVMGDSWGLETPLWFAPKGMEPRDIVSFRRSNDFPHVKAECLAVRERVGVTEIANFAKYSISGPGAEAFLSRLMTNRMPRTGRLVLTPMLNESGKLIGDFTIAKAGEDRFFMFGSSQAQIYHMCWFERQLPADGSVKIRALGMELVGLSIAGPQARAVLAKLTQEDVSNDAFKFMDFREMDVGSVPTLTNRISYTGDLGYEIWVRPEYQRRLYETIMTAGAEFGIANFGMRALLSLRLEKNFGTWYREYRPIYGPFEAGLHRFVDLKKNDFIGRDAALKEHADGPALARVCMIVDADDADVLGDEPIWHDGTVVGWVTSGGYGHFVDKSLAQGYIPAALAKAGGNGGLEIEIIGDRRQARIHDAPLFDPEAKRMRG